MQIHEARELARSAQLIAGVTVKGVVTLDSTSGDKALILDTVRGTRVARLRVKDADGALHRLAEFMDVKGHGWVRLRMCCECFGRLDAIDGHYHERMGVRGAEPICCSCYETKRGRPCSVR